MNKEEFIRNLYRDFNDRNIEAILKLLTPDVQWANGWEGGFVHGHEGVSEYWTRQWAEINPTVDPVTISENENGQMEIDVHQVVKDHYGKVIFDGHVNHLFTLQNGLVSKFEIA